MGFDGKSQGMVGGTESPGKSWAAMLNDVRGAA